MPTKVIMPQLGESVVEGTVGKWLKRVGDVVNEFEPLLEINTDKVDTEIPSPAAGVVLQILVPEGATVERGALLALIGQVGEVIPDGPANLAPGISQSAAHGSQALAPAKSAGTVPTTAEYQSQRYSPVVARMAAENNIDLSQIQGTGMGGRVTKKDVEAYLAGGSQNKPLEAWEQPVSGDLFKPTEEIFAKASGQPVMTSREQPSVSVQPVQPAQSSALSPQSLTGGQLVPLNAMRRAIADHMVRSKLQTAPHVTTLFEIDMSRVMAHWQDNIDSFAAQGLKLTLTAYFVTALVKAAQAQPTLNSQWTNDGLFVHNAVNVGMAVALADGLIVPVIKNAQDLNLSGMARQVSDLAGRARNKTLKPDEVTGGTITLTNHGVSGSLLATPIINQPQSAIVGVGAVQKRVVVVEDPATKSDLMAIRPMMYVTLTFDHRVADGAIADSFLATFKKTLETWT